MGFEAFFGWIEKQLPRVAGKLHISGKWFCSIVAQGFSGQDGRQKSTLGIAKDTLHWHTKPSILPVDRGQPQVLRGTGFIL